MKKFLSLVLALVMTMSLVTISAGAKDFTDKSAIKYGEAVDVMSAIKVIDGYADGSFGATGTLTRGAAAKIICNMILGPTTAGALSANAAPFKDVPANHTFAAYIAYCSQQKIINGYADGTFKPAGTVTGFQFLKMLLGALGYESDKAGFVGANWTINVAKLAFSLGLIDGNDEFVGAKAMTREEACLYGTNTLQATMVEYDNSFNISVGDTVISGNAKPQDVANTAVTQGMKQDRLMQFGEKYFTKLVVRANSNDFQTPTNKWTNAGKEIGNYVDNADMTYTEKVKVSDMYVDLGLSATPVTVNYVIDGVTSNGLMGGTFNKSNSTKLGGVGSTTSAFYNSDTDALTIVMVNSYLGKVTAIEDATKTADRKITIAGRGPGALVAGALETDSFARQDYVIFTSASTDGGGTYNVKSATAAKIVTGTLTSYTGTDSVIVGGTTYKIGNKAATNGQAYGNVGDEVDLYLDANGFVVDIQTSEAAPSNYAYVLNADNNGGFGNRATLLMMDGTKKTAVSTKNTYTALIGDLVSFSVNADGVYTLKDANGTDNNGLAGAFKTTNGNATISVGGVNYTANDETIFVVETRNAGNSTYSVYTGYKNVPSIHAKGNVNGTANLVADIYCKVLGVAKFVFVYADNAASDLSGSNKDVVYIVGDGNASRSVNSDSRYYTFKAVVNGEIVNDFKVDEGDVYVSGSNSLASGATGVNSKVFNGKTTDKFGVNTLTSQLLNANDAYKSVGISEATAGVVTFPSGRDDAGNVTAGITRAYASDCKVFYVKTNGDILAYEIGSIAPDSNDLITYTLKDGLVNNIFIQAVAGV